MKRFKLLLVALATVSFTAFYACGGQDDTEETKDSTEVMVDEPEVIEETTPDSAEVIAPDSTEVETETTEEVVDEETN